MPEVSPIQGSKRFQKRARFETMTSRALAAAEGVQVADVWCRARGGTRSDEEVSPGWTLVMPHRGVFIWEVENRRVVADPNTVLLFRPGEAHRVSHPVDGGDACVALRLSDEWVESAFGIGERLPRHWILDGASQRAVHTAAHSLGEACGNLQVEETVAGILGTISGANAPATMRHQGIVDAVRERIACDPTEHVTIRSLAAGSGRR